MTFQKGKSGNPSGRPKILEQDDLQKMLTVLRKEALAGKPWALKLYFEQVVSKCKLLEKIPVNLDSLNINNIVKNIASIKEMTLQEMLNIAKIVGNLNIADESSASLVKYFNEEQLITIHGWLEEAKKNLINR